MKWSIYSSGKYNLWSSDIETNTREEFKVNGQRLKHYLGGKIIED